MTNRQPNINMCPATDANIHVTISNTYNNENIWALNNTTRGKNTYDKLELGDICIFGNLKSGYNYYGKIKEKRVLDDYSIWPYPSPSDTSWKYAFVLEDIKICNISPIRARELRGWPNNKQSWQTQTKLKPGHGYENFYNYLNNL